MRRIITALAFALVGTFQLTAEVIEVEIAEKNGSAYLNLQNLEVTQTSNSNWDIGFMTGFNASIITNGGQSVRLWHVTDASIDDFDMPLDTTGKFETWVEQINSPDTWSIGAFNLGVNGFDGSTGDFGWGQYSQTVITGTELFVIKLRNGEYKKIVINDLVSSIYSFTYSDLNNNNKKTVELSKSDFAGKQFGYYDLQEAKQIDREPLKSDWDLEFSKYLELVTMQGTSQFYGVTGVRSNSNVKVAQLDEVDVINTPAPNEEDFSKSITTIGWDWKQFDFALGYVLAENRVYFVQRYESKDNGNGVEEIPVGDLHKLVFTAFGSNKFTINFNEVTASVNENNYDNSKFAVYPNVVNKNDKLSLVYSGSDLGQATMNIYSATGQNVHSQNVELTDNLQISNINTSDLNSGIYFVRIQNGNSTYTQKFIVR